MFNKIKEFFTVEAPSKNFFPPPPPENKSDEATMEEILTSIRKIISDDTPIEHFTSRRRTGMDVNSSPDKPIQIDDYFQELELLRRIIRALRDEMPIKLKSTDKIDEIKNQLSGTDNPSAVALNADQYQLLFELYKRV